MDIKQKHIYYSALIERNKKYDGIFYVGVKTTGVFCHATCPAKKPKFENCEFFSTAKEALLASYRPCKRCNPLLPPSQQSETIKKLIEAVEDNPEKRWKYQDFKALGIDESTARRQFKKRFGMTFVEYARARRLGLAMNQIRAGSTVINAQLEAGYESGSGFRDAFTRILGAVPAKTDGKALFASWIDTPLGPMIAIVDENYLYLLEFVDRRSLEKEIERLRRRLKVAIIPGKTKITEQIKAELSAYFSGTSYMFHTPCYLLGSAFDQSVWNALKQIPPGQTCSYITIARKIGRSNSFRSVANANGKNQLAIIIPCHRVINESGRLGGYGGGLNRKQWLIAHEKGGTNE